MAMADANPYIIAVIGSGSALLGVVIATVTQIITATSVRRSQHELLNTQSAIAIQQSLHAERRRAYADFLAAADRLDTLIAIEGTIESAGEEIDEQWWTVVARSEPLRLLGPSAVSQVATEFTENLKLATIAVLQRQPGPLGRSKIHLRLISAMQDALDISQSDRRPVPSTDLPAAPHAHE
jgi:GAF domain-containing protein